MNMNINTAVVNIMLPDDGLFDQLCNRRPVDNHATGQIQPTGVDRVCSAGVVLECPDSGTLSDAVALRSGSRGGHSVQKSASRPSTRSGRNYSSISDDTTHDAVALRSGSRGDNSVQKSTSRPSTRSGRIYSSISDDTTNDAVALRSESRGDNSVQKSTSHPNTLISLSTPLLVSTPSSTAADNDVVPLHPASHGDLSVQSIQSAQSVQSISRPRDPMPQPSGSRRDYSVQPSIIGSRTLRSGRSSRFTTVDGGAVPLPSPFRLPPSTFTSPSLSPPPSLYSPFITGDSGTVPLPFSFVFLVPPDNNSTQPPHDITSAQSAQSVQSVQSVQSNSRPRDPMPQPPGSCRDYSVQPSIIGSRTLRSGRSSRCR